MSVCLHHQNKLKLLFTFKTTAMFRNHFIPISLVTILSFLFMWTATASEGDNLKKKVESAVPANNSQNMNINVFNYHGKSHHKDVITLADPHLDFDLENLPKGTYTVAVSYAGEVINTIEMSNLSKDRNVISMEVRNSTGEKVFGSINNAHNFDLSTLPKGKYLVKVYQGENLINKHHLKN